MCPHSPDARRLAHSTVTLGALLARDGIELPSVGGKALVHGHCHHKSVLDFEADLAALRNARLDTRVVDSGCCGMAGSFGFEADPYDVSIACAERSLLPAVRECESDETIVTDGFSCREQIGQTTGRRAFHLAEVLARALPDERNSDG